MCDRNWSKVNKQTQVVPDNLPHTVRKGKQGKARQDDGKGREVK